MSKSKQHLYLFLEENELEYEVSSSLVRLSMNRFVVNEAAQFEVIGIYNLERATKEMADLDIIHHTNTSRKKGPRKMHLIKI